MASPMGTDDFDSSSDDDGVRESSFHVSWLSLAIIDCSQSLGMSGLPGCKYKELRRNLQKDLDQLQDQGVQDVFVFCTRGELIRYRVPNLLDFYRQRGFRVHHKPFLDGDIPTLELCLEILEELQHCLDFRRKTVIHCHEGLGRSGLVAACLLLQLSLLLSPNHIIDIIRGLRGATAIQTVKQYNFIHEFRSKYADYLESKEDSSEGSVSR